MTARSSAVSTPGMKRCRPAQAHGSPSAARITTPRSRRMVPLPSASRSLGNAARCGSKAATAPRSARRRASATEAARVAVSCCDARVTRCSRTAHHQQDAERDGGERRQPRGHAPGSTRGHPLGSTAEPWDQGHHGHHGRRPRPAGTAAVQPLGGRDACQTPGDHDMRGPLHLKSLVPDAVGLALERDPRLLVPVGTCEQHGPHLPLGCDTIIVERLADDLSADFQILRAPTVEYGVNSVSRRRFPGNASVRRKTLHRWMNDLLGSWEQAGVDAFIILTAHGYDPHQEALSTLRTRQARVLTVDVFALDFSGHLEDADTPMHGSELDTSLLLYVAPELVDMSQARDFPLLDAEVEGE